MTFVEAWRQGAKQHTNETIITSCHDESLSWLNSLRCTKLLFWKQELHVFTAQLTHPKNSNLLQVYNNNNNVQGFSYSLTLIVYTETFTPSRNEWSNCCCRFSKNKYSCFSLLIVKKKGPKRSNCHMFYWITLCIYIYVHGGCLFSLFRRLPFGPVLPSFISLTEEDTPSSIIR